MLSAPSGTGAPVKIRTACPRGSATRSNNYVILKDLITPFVTTAFNYAIDTSIPELVKPSPELAQLNVKPATDCLDTPDLEMDDPKAYLFIKMCPVSSKMFVDTIYWDGSEFQFASMRFVPRLDIDYCYVKIKSNLQDSLPEGEGEGEEERMLFDETVSIAGLV